MIETPLGVLRAAEIAGASPRLAALVLGTSDLTKDLNARETRDRLPLMTASGWCCSRRGRTDARCSTGSSSTLPTQKGSPRPAGRGASWASTARR